LRAAISWRYPLVELAVGGSGAARLGFFEVKSQPDVPAIDVALAHTLGMMVFYWMLWLWLRSTRRISGFPTSSPFPESLWVYPDSHSCSR